MKGKWAPALAATVLILARQTGLAEDRYVSTEGGHVPPFTTWATAATNIQDAIDAASAGDIVWVTNGVYSTGGKVMAGDLTNRVALDKALTVQSVNGPEVTVIEGVWHPGTTNGTTAVRGAWLTDGATLSGFTVRLGGTRENSSGIASDKSGGGIWATSTSARAINCLISGNAAFYQGGGAYQVTLVDCSLKENIARSYGIPGVSAGNSGQGGGAARCDLFNCRVSSNTAFIHGGGVADCQLWNCALTGNSADLFGGAAYQSTLVHSTAFENLTGGYGAYGAAVAYSTLTNCIVFGNSARWPSRPETNIYNCTVSYSCTEPVVVGEGNIGSDPELLPDGIHMSATSPCRGAGTNLNTGVDIDGQAWATPPSMGCDEWNPSPIIAVQPAILPLSGPGQCRMGGASLAGQEPFAITWRKDGEQVTIGSHYALTPTSDLVVRDFGPADAGDYEMVSSNEFGAATSSIVNVRLHCVDAAGAMPTPPYSEWATAATTIQDAIEIAGAGDFVLVTNGVYDTGGKAVDGDLTNRVTLDKPVQLISVAGPQHTIIHGQYDPVTTNGPAAVRCAWLANGAVLNGFTLTRGATRSGSVPTTKTQGGGVACSSIVDSYVVNCVITSNCAAVGGGGSRGGRLVNCAITGNRAEGRFAGGGGALGGDLLNCTVAGNFAGYIGGGTQDATLTNCIVYFNEASFVGGEDVVGGPIAYSCVPGLNTLGGNISEYPQLVDGYHIATTSPCRGAGDPTAATGVDLDGQEWADPPSIGCDEVWEDALVGPISVSAYVWPEEPVERIRAYVRGNASGRVSRMAWDFGDGSSLTNESFLWAWRIWTNAGDYTLTFTAYNTDHPEGVSTNMTVHVVPLMIPELAVSGVTDSTFSVTFQGQSNVNYSLQEATNLVPPVAWKTVDGDVGFGDPIIFVRAKGTNDAAFYRLLIQ